MTDRKLKAILDAEQANRVKAPETTKLADLLWAFAESITDSERHAAVGFIASTVGEWASKGQNIGAPEALVVLEAAFKAAGVRL